MRRTRLKSQHGDKMRRPYRKTGRRRRDQVPDNARAAGADTHVLRQDARRKGAYNANCNCYTDQFPVMVISYAVIYFKHGPSPALNPYFALVRLIHHTTFSPITPPLLGY